MLVEVKPRWGQDIRVFADEMIRFRKDTLDIPYGVFNGVTLIAKWGKAAHVLVGEFHKQMRIQSEAYRNSDEHKEHLRQEALDQERRAVRAERLISEMDSLDWSNYTAVILWLFAAQDLTEYRNLMPNSLILEKLKEAGYISSEFASNDPESVFNPAENQEKTARYMLGQAMSFLNGGHGVHRMFGYFAERYASDFGLTLPEKEE